MTPPAIVGASGVAKGEPDPDRRQGGVQRPHQRRLAARASEAGMARIRNQAPPTLERKIHFYRADVGEDGGGKPLPFDPSPALDVINRPPFASGSASRYLLDDDGNAVCAWPCVRSEKTVRFCQVRRTGLPQLEQAPAVARWRRRYREAADRAAVHPRSRAAQRRPPLVGQPTAAHSRAPAGRPATNRTASHGRESLTCACRAGIDCKRSTRRIQTCDPFAGDKKVLIVFHLMQAHGPPLYISACWPGPHALSPKPCCLRLPTLSG
jgi:hypothetical protein